MWLLEQLWIYVGIFEKSEMKRYIEIDVIKGLTILLVVLGHCQCQYPINNEEVLSSMFIYAYKCFPMPLFIMVSGFLYKEKGSWKLFFKEKISRLIVPYAFFSLLFLIKRNLTSSITGHQPIAFGDFLYSLLIGENYWFLWTLFFMLCVYKLARKYTFSMIAILFAVLFYFFEASLPFSIGRLFQLSCFFVVGVLIRKKYAEFKRFSCNLLGLLFFIALFWASLLMNEYFLFYHFISPLLGAISMWILSVMISPISSVTKVLSHFGKYSLQYYLNHLLIITLAFYFVKYAHLDYKYINLCVPFIFAVLGSFLLLKIENCNKYLKYLAGLN